MMLRAVCRGPSGRKQVLQVAAVQRPSSSVRTISDGAGTWSLRLAGRWPAGGVLREVCTRSGQHR